MVPLLFSVRPSGRVEPEARAQVTVLLLSALAFKVALYDTPTYPASRFVVEISGSVVTLVPPLTGDSL